MRSQIVLIITLANTLFNGVQLFAQSNSGSKGPPAPNLSKSSGPPGPPEAMIPIDDNILILLIAGLILGVYYFYRVRATTKKVA